MMFEQQRKPRKQRRLAVQCLESRRLLAASLGWDGPGLGGAELTYYVANSPSSLSQAETLVAIETAFAAWSSAADITFTETDQPGLRDSIDISFTNIDGIGRTLAQAYFPEDVNPARIAGDIQFDITEAWEVGNALGRQAFDLAYVAVHDIGHSLGLDHTGEVNSVLAPFVSPNQSFGGLNAVDVAAIQDLYAAADGSVTDAPIDETPTDETPTDETEDDTTDTGDSDGDPFPRQRWRHGGRWHRFGGRLDAEATFQNYVNPTDVNGDNSTSAVDALTIINQLTRSALLGESESIDVVGLCDTNGDGAITPVDALTVMNALVQSGAASITIVDDAATIEVTDSIDETESSEESDVGNEVDDSGDPVDTAEPVDEVDVAIDPVDDTETPVVTVDDTVEPVDDTTDAETDSDTVEDPIDDGGRVDETDDEHCHGGRHHHSGILHAGLLGKSAGDLISRFDTDDDAALSEVEVSTRLWDKFTDLGVDADADGLVTLEELDAAILAARHEAFNEIDTDADGLLIETEVSERLWAKISPADADADGGVSFDELGTFLAERTTDTAGPEGRSRHHHHRSVDQAFAEIGSSRPRRFFGRR